jgi:hypothetical protein
MTAAVATGDYVEVARALTNMGATETVVDVEKVRLDEERVVTGAKGCDSEG